MYELKTTGGTVFPILINILLTRAGLRWTLRILALLIGVCASIALLGVKPRVPLPSAAGPARSIPRPDLTFMKTPEFIAMVCMTISRLNEF